MPRLSDHFAGIMVKRLSVVETDRKRSNQHEFNGTAEMKHHLGIERQQIKARFIYLGHDEDQRLSLDENVTWYDAREQHPSRTEHRLYFQNNEVMSRASADDILIIGLRNDRSVVLLIVNSESDDLPDVLWLFGTREDLVGQRPQRIDPALVEQRSLSLFNRIAEFAGLDVEIETRDDWLDLLLSRFGERFPPTRALSALARETLEGEISEKEDPDGTLINLMDREEVLFRQLERHIVSRHLEEHADSWAADVDAFVSFSLGVQNRRKSRAGHALENQLEWIIQRNGIRYARGAMTERRSKPDFLFPGAAEYHDEATDPLYLTMLGVKTTCKDRWRQVLREADRIEDKHLLTLQPAISENQTAEMQASRLALVVPSPLHHGFSPAQQHWLISLHQFMCIVAQRDRWLMS